VPKNIIMAAATSQVDTFLIWSLLLTPHGFLWPDSNDLYLQVPF